MGRRARLAHVSLRGATHSEPCAHSPVTKWEKASPRGQKRVRGLTRHCESPATRPQSATNSRRPEISRAAQRKLTLSDRTRRVPERLPHVFGLEVRMLREDLVGRHSIGDHADDGGNGHAKVADTCHATHTVRVSSDAIECHMPENTGPVVAVASKPSWRLKRLTRPRQRVTRARDTHRRDSSGDDTFDGSRCRRSRLRTGQGRRVVHPTAKAGHSH